ncbi:MAG: hypothetical protein JXC85_04175 [Candidatus Aenigmarchaeota archaeon]|nr:hypothetical protein [Candidatus Aenigmarchaeota archaeon]
MLGFYLSVLAAMCFGFSATMQKQSLRGIRRFNFSSLVRSRVWASSLIVGFIGILFYLAALKSAPISIVQPTLSLSIAIPVLAGWFAFGERLGGRWIHILLIILGVMLLSL